MRQEQRPSYPEQIADLQRQLQQAQEEAKGNFRFQQYLRMRLELDAAIEQNKRIMAWVCQFIEKRGSVVFMGLSAVDAIRRGRGAE